MERLARHSMLLLLVAMFAWAGVAMFAWYILKQADVERAAIDETRSSFSKSASDVRLQSLVRETADERTKLNAVFGPDVISVANMIDAVGQASGVSMKLNNAAPEALQRSAGRSLHAVGFAVEGTGSFSSLMRAERMLETLPMAASIENLDLSRIPDSGKTSLWHMSATIRVLTTVNISS